MNQIGTALVTEATGFVGRALCAKLKQRGVQVRELSPLIRDKSERIANSNFGAGRLPDNVMDGTDTVFHLAEKVDSNLNLDGGESEYLRVNVDETRNILKAATNAKIQRFVYFSSVKAGSEGSEACLDEAMEDNPQTPYGRTKLAAERLVFEHARKYKMHAVVLRLPTVYGPGSNESPVRMLEAVLSRRYLPLAEFGNHRSMVHVDDVAEAAILCAERPNANVQTYFVTDGRPYSTRELYGLMCVALGRRKPRLGIPVKVVRAAARLGDMMGRFWGKQFLFNSDALQKLVASTWYSSRKLETELGFKPAYDLEKALPEMVSELRSKLTRENRATKSSQLSRPRF